MSDEESYEYEYDDDMEEDEGGFEYTDDEQDADDGEVALGKIHLFLHKVQRMFFSHSKHH